MAHAPRHGAAEGGRPFDRQQSATRRTTAPHPPLPCRSESRLAAQRDCGSGSRPLPRADSTTGARSPAKAAGSGQRISTSSTSMSARAAGGSRTKSFAVVTSARVRRGRPRGAARRSRLRGRVMVGKAALADKFGAEPAQGCKKFFRPADPGKGEVPAPANRSPQPAPDRRHDRPLADADQRAPSTGSPSAASNTTASARARPRSRLSRNGPAGITRPLPKP